MPENLLVFQFLNDIGDADLRQFTADAIETNHFFENHIEFQKKMLLADKTVDILMDILEEKQIFMREAKPYKAWVDILIAAVYLYYAVKNQQKENSFIELFEVRQHYGPIANRHNISRQTFDVLCQAVEAGCGTSGVPACKPVPGTPTELMALSIFIVEKILPRIDKRLTDHAAAGT